MKSNNNDEHFHLMQVGNPLCLECGEDVSYITQPTNPSGDSIKLDTVDRRFRSISLHSDGRWIVKYFNGKKKSLVSADSATEAMNKFRVRLEAEEK